MPTSKKKETVKVGDRVLLVRDASDKEFKITIPGDAKVTFGPAFRSTKANGNWNPSGNNEYALRIYKGTKDNCIAVFTGVREFREFDMQVDKLIISEAGKRVWKSDEGGYSMTEAVKKKSKFVDVKLLNEGRDDDGPF